MPIYEYRCDACGHHGEELQSIRARPLTKCPECGGRYRRQVSAPAFQFKGSGWYVTDYAKKGGGKAEEKEAPASKGETSAADSKAEKKPAAKKEPVKASKATGD